MADQIPSNHNLTTTDFDSLPIPPLDPTIFSDPFISDVAGPLDGDIDDLDFTFDDLYLSFDSEDFLYSFPTQMDPPGWDPLLFSTDSSTGVPTVPTSDGFCQISGDQSSSDSRILNVSSPVSCQVSGDQISDVAEFLNISPPDSSQESRHKESDVGRFLNYNSPESKTHNVEVSGPVSSQGSGLSGSVVSEALNHLSPDSGNCNRLETASPEFTNNSINGVVDQTIKLEEEGNNNCLLKRKKESEDVKTESRTSKYRRPNAEDNSVPQYGFSAIEEEEEKRKARLMRNRESAQLSRQRKKHYVEELEDKVRTMHSTIQDLNTRISFIMAENASLRQQLSGGAAMCPPPVPLPGMYSRLPMPPMGYPWIPCAPYVVNPQVSEIPRVPIPKLKPQQPSPAPKAKKVETRKSKGKTKKVASISFLGFFFFIMLFGGFVPMVNVKFGGIWDTYNVGNRFYEQHRGRVLAVNRHLNGSDKNIAIGLSNGRFGFKSNFTKTIHYGRGHIAGAESNVGQKEGSQPISGSDEFARPCNSSEPLVASLYVPRNDKLVKIDGNLIIHSVLASERSLAFRKDSGTKSSEETGLAVAGNMAPAIPLTVRNDGRNPHLYKNPSECQRALDSGPADKDNSKSALPEGKVQQWFLEDLAGPMLSSGLCTEVFQFDVLPATGAIVPATSVMIVSAELTPNATTHLVKGRNRRILHRAPIPLPSSRTITKDNDMGSSNPEKENFHGNNSLPSMVVSVLVDPREASYIDNDNVMEPKSLSRIFVVVLIDSIKYVTYSCMIPLKGAGAPLVTA
ncbi:hypothetical protein U1Q18_013823 [Sarracenia purpurea var. burkii]